MAELTGLPVPSMDWEAADLPRALHKFKSLSELIFTGPLVDKDEHIKVKYLLIWSGEEGIDLVSTWQLTADDAKKLETYWTRFEQYASPKSNFRLSRYKLRDVKQGPTESVDQFIKRIRMLANDCKFQDYNDQIIDALIFGTNSDGVKAKLIKKDDNLTIDQTLEIARLEEITRRQVADMSSDHTTQVHAVQMKNKVPSHVKCHRGQGQGHRNSSGITQSSFNNKCGNCGRSHAPTPKEICPA